MVNIEIAKVDVWNGGDFEYVNDRMVIWTGDVEESDVNEEYIKNLLVINGYINSLNDITEVRYFNEDPEAYWIKIGDEWLFEIVVTE